MNVGILGGTFNPIHNGHLELAVSAFQQYHFDEIWFMPSGLPAHKSNSELLDAEQRLEMVELAIQDYSCFKTSSFEINRNGFTYTADTMMALKEHFPDISFFFIIGGDSIMKFHQWVKPEVISSCTTLVAAGRNGYTKTELVSQAAYLNEHYGTKVLFLDMPEVPISSKEIRGYCKRGEYQILQKYVPEAVYHYIVANHLYNR